MKVLLFMARKEFAQRSEAYLRKTEILFNIRFETVTKVCLRRKQKIIEGVQALS